MKRYFLDRKTEITEAEAKEIEAKNKEYMASGDFELMLKCEFITIINA